MNRRNAPPLARLALVPETRLQDVKRPTSFNEGENATYKANRRTCDPRTSRFPETGIELTAGLVVLRKDIGRVVSDHRAASWAALNEHRRLTLDTSGSPATIGGTALVTCGFRECM